MAAPPRNLDFANVTGSGAPDGWVLGEVPAVREYAGFSSVVLTPLEDPNGSTWAALGGAASSADPPYDATAAATLGASTRFTEDSALSGHGLVVPTGRPVGDGQSYTFGAYVRPSAGVFTGPGVGFCGDCLLVAVLSEADGAVVHAGWAADGVHADPGVVEAVAATVSAVAGAAGWFRVAVSFRLAADALARGVAAEANLGVFLFDDAAGTTEYTGAGTASADVWGAFFYEGALLTAETYASEAWVGSGYLSALATPTPAVFPSALPQGTTYEGYDRWAVPYLADLDGYLADASFGAGVVETYADGYGTDNYADVNASVTYATFGGGGTTETYADGWGTDNYADALAAPTQAAWSGDLALDAERYSPAYPEVAYTALPATDRLAAEAHGLVDDVRVRLANAGYPAGAAFPAPLSPHVSYYVVNANADDFQLSTSVGGSAVDLTTEGTGEQFVVPDPRRYWTLES